MKLRGLGTALALLTLAGCSQLPSSHRSLAERIKNRGPLALSDENPYLASNLFLAREMERSKELAGFVKRHGAPSALAVDGDYFAPVTVRLFYPENRAFYTVEDVGDAHIISGPSPLSGEEARELAQITRDVQGKPALATTSPAAASEPAPVAAAETTMPPAQVAERLERAKSRIAATNPASAEEYAEYRPSDGPEAELSPRGDLVHYVTFPGETLSMIARWYTGDRTNAGRIARMNGLPNPDQLRIGDSVVVPKYLLATTKRLTATAVEELAVTAERERAGR